MTRVETWQGFNIRFVEVDGEWYAVLKDICDILNLKTKYVSRRLDADMVKRVLVTEESEMLKNIGSNEVVKSKSNRYMLAINEIGIYETLYASRRLEARKFRRWSCEVMKKLRSKVGLEQYEVMRMLDPDTQEDIDFILDSIYYDEETGKLMRSVTVQGGDVIQTEF